MADRGLTHIAFPVRDLDRSLAFYARYAAMECVHRRAGRGGARVAWVTDRTRPFVLVLIEFPRGPLRRLLGVRIGLRAPRFSHLGVACSSREELDRLAADAREAGVLERGPVEKPPPVGYLALLRDPDGYTLELSVGQEVEFASRPLGATPREAVHETGEWAGPF